MHCPICDGELTETLVGFTPSEFDGPQPEFEYECENCGLIGDEEFFIHEIIALDDSDYPEHPDMCACYECQEHRERMAARYYGQTRYWEEVGVIEPDDKPPF